MSIGELSAQYEAYPYPARDPKDEAKRLITGSPSHLDEVNHFVFAGRLDHGKPLRVLVAGGGTGDGAIQLAQMLRDAGNPGHVTYLDLSHASRAVAQARAEARGLDNVTFLNGSLLDLADADGGPVAGTFDYIDCCGVLHHLPDPGAGLAALAGRLDPGGGMGIMVYAPLGRTGVYPVQDALRALTDGMNPADKVAFARRFIGTLPPSNWLLHNPLISDHRSADANLYDLLLHSRDRPYTVEALAALVDGAGLAITALIDPAAYDPATWIKDPRALKRMNDWGWLEKAAMAEKLCGSMTKHIAYLVRPDRVGAAVAHVNDPDTGSRMVPVLRDMDGAEVARALPPGGVMEAEINGAMVPLPLPRLAGPILARVDGRRTIAELHRAVAEGTGAAIAWDAFKVQFDQLFIALNRVGKMYLRFPPV